MWKRICAGKGDAFGLPRHLVASRHASGSRFVPPGSCASKTPYLARVRVRVRVRGRVRVRVRVRG